MGTETTREVHTYIVKRNTALFDSRVFSIPKEEVCNCLIWRQQDATRNSIEAVGQANFNHNGIESWNRAVRNVTMDGGYNKWRR